MAHGCGAKHICKSKCAKHHIRGTDFGCYDLEKWRAALARSTFASQNAQKHRMLGPLFELQMSKNRTGLWREAHLQVKCTKHRMRGPLFEALTSTIRTPLWREVHV